MNQLTPRERELASLVAAGFSNREIAGMLLICRQTVKNHILAVYRKLEVNNRVELSLRLSGRSVEEVQLQLRRGLSQFSEPNSGNYQTTADRSPAE